MFPGLLLASTQSKNARLRCEHQNRNLNECGANPKNFKEKNFPG